MSDKHYIGKKAQSVDSAPKLDAYSKVVIVVDEETEYSAGDDTGRTLTLENPWGTKKMAQNILADIKGFQYQPFTAQGAILDPAAELGDGVMVNGLYGGIYSVTTTYGRLCRAKVSAPSEEELESEYPFASKSERKIQRKISGISQKTADLKIDVDKISAKVTKITEEGGTLSTIQSTLTQQAGKIEAKVEKRVGDENSSFGWELLDDSWTIRAKGTPVLTATESGLEVYGKITATGGSIGGFNIESDYLSFNDLIWGGAGSGAYIGVHGIQLGPNFKVDMNGDLEAYSGKFTGSVTAGKILYGTDAATGDYYGTLSGTALTVSTVGTTQTTSGINTSLGYADYANGVFTGVNDANFADGKLFLDGYRLTRKTLSINGEYVNLVGWVSTSGG